MELTCATQDGTRVTTVQVGPTATFGDVKAILAVTFKASPNQLHLTFKQDTSIPDTATLGSQGVADKDMLLVSFKHTRAVAPPRNAGTNPGLATLEQLIPPNLRGLDFARLFTPQTQRQPQQNRNAAAIKQNFEMAMQENPESFASVYMLYINVVVNGTPVKAFVDSGAQTTIMSKACAIKCNIIDMVDPRFAGVAMGVGSAKILGRVHLAPMNIGGQFYNASFSVLDQAQNVEILIGLDMLKRYQCNIDLKNDLLHIGTTDQTVPFLTEAELPAHAKLR